MIEYGLCLRRSLLRLKTETLLLLQQFWSFDTPRYYTAERCYQKLIEHFLKMSIIISFHLIMTYTIYLPMILLYT